jgi:hypothetical protein
MVKIDMCLDGLAGFFTIENWGQFVKRLLCGARLCLKYSSLSASSTHSLRLQSPGNFYGETSIHWQRAFTNNHGFERPGDPRRDYINGKNLSDPLPKVECLLCGGALVSIVRETIVRGIEVYELEVLNGRRSPPTVKFLLERPWLYFQAVSVSVTGIVRSFSISPYPEYVPFVSFGTPVYMPKKNIRLFKDGEPVQADPYYP